MFFVRITQARKLQGVSEDSGLNSGSVGGDWELWLGG